MNTFLIPKLTDVTTQKKKKKVNTDDTKSINSNSNYCQRSIDSKSL